MILKCRYGYETLQQMDYPSFAVRLWLLSLITLSSVTLTACTMTQYPALVCEGDRLEVNCKLSVPNTGDEFIYTEDNFDISGSSIGSVDLSKSTTVVISSNATNIHSRLIIFSYTAADDITLIRCSSWYFVDGDRSDEEYVSESLQLMLVDPPSSPVVTLSQTDNSCSNTLISWSTPSNDRSITSYSVYRNNTLIHNAPNTTNQYTDNTQLNINTVYEYSVVAISCAGNSTAGVMSVSIGEFELNNVTSLVYDSSSNAVSVSWSLYPEYQTTHYLIVYSLMIEYTHTQSDDTSNGVRLNTFSQLSNNNSYSTSIPEKLFDTYDTVVTRITVILSITQQCMTPFTGTQISESVSREYTPTVYTTPTNSTNRFNPTISNNNYNHSISINSYNPTVSINNYNPTTSIHNYTGLLIGAGVVLVVVVVGCASCLSVMLLILCCVLRNGMTGYSVCKENHIYSVPACEDNPDFGKKVAPKDPIYSVVKKKNKKTKLPQVEDKKMEGVYVAIDHTIPKPENIKKPNFIEKTLYVVLQSPKDYSSGDGSVPYSP